MAFDKQAFESAFTKLLKKLAGAEKITKEALLSLSRSVLDAHHQTQDIGYINRLMAVLSPMNKRTAVLFFKEFSGFKYDDDKQEFSSKDKKHYDAKHALCIAFLEDPLNNIWSWAARNVEMEAKPFEMDKFSKSFASQLKKAEEAGFTQADVMRAIIKQGISLETMLALLSSEFEVDVKEGQ